MDKNLLLKPRLPEADVEIPGVGTVRVRGLNRAEAIRIQEAPGVAAKERLMLHLGLVDPQLSEAEARQWHEASAASEIDPVTLKIAELSGLLPGQDKEAYKSFRDESGSGVSVLPGPETGDDGGSAKRTDEQ